MQVNVGVARHEPQIEVLRDIQPELGREGQIVIVIIVARFARLQQVKRSHRHRPGVKVHHVGTVVKGILRAADAAALIERVEGAAFEQPGELRRAGTGFGDDVDHPAYGVGAVQAALRAAQHLDAFDVLGEQLPEVERSGGVTRVADVDAVHEHLGVIGVGAAYEYRGDPAGPAGLHHVQARDVLENIRKRALLPRLDVRGADERDAARDLKLRGGNTRRGEHDGLQLLRVSRACRAGGRRERKSDAPGQHSRGRCPLNAYRKSGCHGFKLRKKAHTRARGRVALRKLKGCGPRMRTAHPHRPPRRPSVIREAGLRAPELEELSGGSPSRPLRGQWHM